MAQIDTLIKDIYALLQRKDGWFNDELAAHLSREMSLRLQHSFAEDQGRRGLRLSRLGNFCDRELWYSVNKPELAEKPKGWAINKFSYGHILEAWALTLARAAGHTVEGEQDELVVDGIKGHRDCVIDGCIVDVKSVTSFGREELEKKTLAQSDPFGRLFQLDGYLLGSHGDPLVIEKDTGYLLGIDKTLGHMVLYRHEKREQLVRDRIARYKDIVRASTPPACTCQTLLEGEAGNIKLGTKASYSDFKWECFPGLRCFLYAKGPVYLSKVAKRPAPHIVEVNKDGKVIY
jgi:hypothetical protein